MVRRESLLVLISCRPRDPALRCVRPVAGSLGQVYPDSTRKKTRLERASRKRGVNRMAENQDRSLIVSTEDDVVTLKLNRPQVRNAVNFGLLQDLEHALDRLYEKPPRVIVLTATPPGFCAGIDLKESREASADFARVRVSTMHRVLRKLRIIPVPVISAIDGVTAGSGHRVDDLGRPALRQTRFSVQLSGAARRRAITRAPAGESGRTYTRSGYAAYRSLGGAGRG